MASATWKTVNIYRDERRRLRRVIRVDVTGLSAGANTIAHGIVTPNNPSAGALPCCESLQPTSAVVCHQTQAADATNLYYTVDSGAGTTISVYVEV